MSRRALSTLLATTLAVSGITGVVLAPTAGARSGAISSGAAAPERAQLQTAAEATIAAAKVAGISVRYTSTRAGKVGYNTIHQIDRTGTILHTPGQVAELDARNGFTTYTQSGPYITRYTARHKVDALDRQVMNRFGVTPNTWIVTRYTGRFAEIGRVSSTQNPGVLAKRLLPDAYGMRTTPAGDIRLTVRQRDWARVAQPYLAASKKPVVVDFRLDAGRIVSASAVIASTGETMRLAVLSYNAPDAALPPVSERAGRTTSLNVDAAFQSREVHNANERLLASQLRGRISREDLAYYNRRGGSQQFGAISVRSIATYSAATGTLTLSASSRGTTWSTTFSIRNNRLRLGPVTLQLPPRR